MADKKKRKSKDNNTENPNKKPKSKSLTTEKRGGGGKGKNARKGPRLPTAIRQEVERLNPRQDFDDEDIESDEGNDVYEYEEGVPEEESKKNRRFDRVENYEYELPENFEV